MDSPLVIAVSARSLFKMEKENAIFEEKGLQAYIEYAKEHENEPLEPGPAFPIIKALMDANISIDEKKCIEIISVSSIHPEAGLRVISSIQHHGLEIKRTSFTGGADVMPYIKAFGVDLLLTRSKEDAQEAINAGIAAAIMYSTPDSYKIEGNGPIRIAFDGDAVLFTEASERIFKGKGIQAFMEHEMSNADNPLEEGPFAKVLQMIHHIQKHSPGGEKPFRIALVTARGGQARERVLKTFKAWQIDVDEAHFLSGYRKAGILEAFDPHIFFDDQDCHVGPASEIAPSALVPWKAA